MANNGSLTATLQTEDQGKRTIAPPTPVEPPSNNFIGGLSRFAEGVASGVSSFTQQSWQQTEHANTLDERNTQNATVKAVQDRMADFTRVQEAVKQGLLPPTAVDLNLDSTMDSLRQQHPGQEYIIAKTMQELGAYHYVNEDVINQHKVQDEQRDAKESQMQGAYQAAGRYGLVGPNTTFDEGVAAGNAVLAAEAKVKAAKEYWEAQNTQMDVEDKRRNQLRTDTDRAIFTNLTDIVGKQWNTLYASTAALVDQSIGNPELEKAVTTQLPTALSNALNTSENAMVQQATQSHGSPDVIKQIHEDFANRKKQVTEMFTGPLSLIAQRHQVFQSMQDQLGIDSYHAFPLYNMLSKVMGPQALALHFGGDPANALDPKIIKGLQDEVKGFNTADKNDMAIHMMNIQKLLSGEMNIHQLTAKDAMTVMPTMGAVSVGNSADIARGNRDPETISKFGNSYAQVVNATAALGPTTTTVDQVATATKYLANPAARTALAVMFKDPTTKEQAGEVAQASRGAAAKALNIAQATPQDGQSYFSPSYDTKRGVYTLKFDSTAYEADSKSHHNKLEGNAYATIHMPPASQLKPTADQQKQVDTMNALLTHLTETSQYDGEIPKGVTPLQLREHYATGKALPSTTEGQPGKNPLNDLLTQVSNLQKSAENLTLNNVKEAAADAQKVNPTHALSYFQGKGWTREVSSGIVGNLIHESNGMDPNAKDGTGSEGIAQWRGDRLKALQNFAGEQHQDWHSGDVQLAFVQHEIEANPDIAKALKAAKTPGEAAQIFMMLFERPKGSETGDPAKTLGYNERVRHANGVFMYGG
jgi:hypothetical protein